MGKVKGKKKNKRPEYVVICREFNRAEARIEISVIDSGVTDHLMNNLIKMHLRDPHKRYFLTLKKIIRFTAPCGKNRSKQCQSRIINESSN